MAYISLLIVLTIIGVLAWAIITYIPMIEGVKTVIKIAAVVLAVVYVLNAFGVIGGVSAVRVPSLR